MFIIIHDNQVVLGPMRWNRFRFENFLEEEHEISTTLPDKNENSPVIVSDICKILPIAGSPNPDYNPRIEMLQGPFWDITDELATSSYQVASMPVDAVKNQLKALTSAERNSREAKWITQTIQGQSISIDTSKENRNSLVQKLVAIAESDIVNWKFGAVFLTLTYNEIKDLISALDAHIQTQFDWQLNKIAEIEACETLSELDAIVIQETTGVI